MVELLDSRGVNAQIDLESNWGNLQVSSMPQGANITLNGKATTYTTPHLFEQQQAGAMFLELDKPGYGKKTFEAEIKGDKSTRKVDLTLTPFLAKVGIEAEYPDGKACSNGKVYLDDDYIGLSPLQKEVVAIPHEILIDCNGMKGKTTIKPKHQDDFEVAIKVLPYSSADLSKARQSSMLNQGLDFGIYALASTSLIMATQHRAQHRRFTSEAESIQDPLMADAFYTAEANALDAHQNAQIWLGVGISSAAIGLAHQAFWTRKKHKEVREIKAVMESVK